MCHSGHLCQILDNKILKSEKFFSHDTWIFLRAGRFLGHVFHMSTPLQNITFCYLQFWRCDWVPPRLKRRKTSCYSLALETETTETTWFSNARANCYNKHLENKSQTFHHLECILEQTNLFYLTLVILTSETSWVQKVEEMDKKKKYKKEKEITANKADRMFSCGEIWRYKKTSPSLLQWADSWCLDLCTSHDFSCFAKDANTVSPCLSLHSLARGTVMVGRG